MTQPAVSGTEGGATRAGFVALVGRPNVGKSTLLNALTGEKLSIVTPLAQTTRDRVTGIYSDQDTQIVFVDTPGLLEPEYLLQRSMLETALGALAESDLVLLLLDATRPAEIPEGEALELLRRRRSELRVVLNKMDRADPGAADRLEAWCRQALDLSCRRISAATGEGVEELRRELASALPAGPFFYPADEVAVQPVRFFVAELIRETVFEEYGEEVPYATVVRIEEFREQAEPIYIRATVYVERDSQKAILIGRGGAAIKKLGERSRNKIESFLDGRVYLDLWVKPLAGWRRKPGALKFLGYAVPEPDTQPKTGRRRRDVG